MKVYYTMKTMKYQKYNVKTHTNISENNKSNLTNKNAINKTSKNTLT